MKTKTLAPFAIAILMGFPHFAVGQETGRYAPPPEERQLPFSMHSEMETLPEISVGQKEGDITGKDNRALQAAVDYIAGLGGGTVNVGEGEYIMRDSLHLRSNVTVRGVPGKTVLKMADGPVSPLLLDGDYGEEQITLANPEGFEVGYGVAVWDENAGGFHTTVARITGKRGNTVSIDTPLNADCMVSNKAAAAVVFPVVSGSNVTNAAVENIIADGNKDNNIMLNGCRGAGIYLFRGHGCVIKRCVARNYNGDGISFQQSNDVKVLHCVSEDNTQLGIHPGSGSQRPVVGNSAARRNGTDGLFLCWRVRHGVFENNVLEENGRFGISIGHKDTDNLLRKNTARANRLNGVFFRNESYGMAGHRNRLEENIIENNGEEPGTAGIRIRGETHGLIFDSNIIRDTRDEGKTQTVGVLIEETAGPVEMANNKIDAETPVDDRRAANE